MSKPRQSPFLRLAVFASYLAALVMIPAAVGAAPDWNQFRGPNGSGAAADAKPPLKPGPENLAWKTPLPRGLSSPVISRGRIFLTGVEEKQLVTLAFDATTGKPLWRKEAPMVPLEPVHSLNSHATPTPCTDGERVFVWFGSFGLLCYNLDGRELWQKPIPAPKSLYGAAASPIVLGNLVILALDNDANLAGSKLSQSRLLAVKRATGETAWEIARPLQRSNWSTPAVWSRADGDEIVVPGNGRVCGYDARTGAEKWFVTGFARETIAVPVFGDDRAFVASAMGGQADQKPDPEPLWKAMLHFDTNGDGKIARTEISEHFTFPLRPEVPPSHPGFGIPLASDPERRRKQQEGHFDGIDKNRDGIWTHDEFVANLGSRPFKPRLVAIRAGGHADATDSHVAWELNRGIPEIPSPLFYEGRIYLVRNGGVLNCVDAATGRSQYDERLGADGQYSASPVLAGGHLYLLSNKGVVSVVKAGATFERAHQFNLGEPSAVTPAIDATAIYFRTESHLHAFRTK